MSESQRLLAEYAEGSEEAFRNLVNRYIDFVYSAALRLVDGDTHLAEDIAQTVFLDLARAAGKLSTQISLGGWLHRHTCFVASKTMRAKRRRQSREKEAVEMNTLQEHPNFAEICQLLDEAINHLGALDRSAIILRFFEGLDFHAVGLALGSNEDAAQKRVSRALEKLHGLLMKRGVKISAAGLALALSTQAVSAAPAGMAAGIASSVLLAAPESVSTFSLIKFMAFSKTKIAAVAALLALGLGVPMLFNHQANARTAQLERNVGEQEAKLLMAAQQNESAAILLQKMEQTARHDADETAALAAEASELRKMADAIKPLREEIHQLSLRREGEKTYWQNNEENFARQKLTKAWLTAFLTFASAHEGELPSTFDEAEAFFPTNAVKGTIPPEEQFEILYHGSLQTLADLDPKKQFIIFRERKLHPMLHNYGGTNYHKMGRHIAQNNGLEGWFSVPTGTIDSELTAYELDHLPSAGAP
jgi:RNA polymerase sigma factor (sigma-70 family)